MMMIMCGVVWGGEDMGAEDASDVNVMRLTQLAQSSEVDVILHAGDIGYADGFENVWDDYMRKVEFFAAYVPYMTAVGNHEFFYNFTDFKKRFSMPGDESGSVCHHHHHQILTIILSLKDR